MATFALEPPRLNSLEYSSILDILNINGQVYEVIDLEGYIYIRKNTMEPHYISKSVPLAAPNSNPHCDPRFAHGPSCSLIVHHVRGEWMLGTKSPRVD